MATLKLDIDDLNALELAGKAGTIVAAMSGNNTFPTPDPSLTTLTTQADTLSDAYAVQKQKVADAASATQATDTALQTLKASLRTLGAYVQKTSGGDAEKILSSGYAVAKDREPAQIPPAPDGVNATYGDSPGEIDLSWNPIPGRPTYEVHLSEGDTATYRYAASSTKSKATLEGLTSGTLYHLKIRAMNPAGQGPFSNPITQRAS